MSMKNWLILGGIAYLLRDTTVETVHDALDEWDPEGHFDNESDFCTDLAEFLREECPDTYVVQEHGIGRGRRDLRVENRDSGAAVAIELKYGLSSPAKMQRLVGQIVQYSPDVRAVFVVLIDSNPNHLAEFEKLAQANFANNVIVVAFDMEDARA